ncbi:MAG: 50S ribosomal protein L17 [bacterium]
MRHRNDHRKLGRASGHRMAMLRNLATDLLKHGRIQTTEAKAKEVRRLAERLITLGKRGDLHARRMAIRIIYDKDVTYKLFDEIAERYKETNGGYTRILKLGPRRGDSAPMAIIELTEGT